MCAHCHSLLIRRDLDLKSLGRVAQLKEDISPIQQGAIGVFKEVPFVVVGRLQLKYEGGYWSEWHIALADGRSGWLSESMGECMVSFKTPYETAPPSMDTLEPGASVLINHEEFTVKTIDHASIYSAEGELPEEVSLGEQTTLVDLVKPGGSFATLDYGEEPPTLYLGEYTKVDQLKMTGLKIGR